MSEPFYPPLTLSIDSADSLYVRINQLRNMEQYIRMMIKEVIKNAEPTLDEWAKIWKDNDIP